MLKESRVRIRKQLVSPFLYILLLIFNICFLASCTVDSVYEKNIDLDNRVWLADSAVGFTFQIADAASLYDIYYHFRNTISYPYQNLYISCSLENEEGKVLLTDLKNIELFDVKTGKPFGKGLGDIFSHEYEAITGYQFPDSGSFTLKLQQYMRRDTLPEILSVGVSIKKANGSEE